MILVDANILIYAVDQCSERHEQAKAWFDSQLNGDTQVGLPWESLLAFLRLTTHPRVFSRPLTVSAAWALVETWLDCENVRILVPGAAHRSILAGLLANLGGGAKLIPDAHLAALAIEQGLVLCSTDGDFARFRGLQWINPLILDFAPKSRQ